VQSVVEQAGKLVIELPEDQAAALNAALVGAGLQVSELAREQPTLEQAYLEWMARDETAT